MHHKYEIEPPLLTDFVCSIYDTKSGGTLLGRDQLFGLKMAGLQTDAVRRFWNQVHSKTPAKVFAVLPEDSLGSSAIAGLDATTPSTSNVGRHKSYGEAYRACCHAVESIIVECERVNQKYTDPHFNLEVDLKSGTRYCLDGLERMNDEMRPKGVKRVTVLYAQAPIPLQSRGVC